MSVVRRVVKVGGSLADCNDRWRRLSDWLRTVGPSESILVFGGGTEVDALRVRDQREQLDPAALHWQCIAWMRHHAQTALTAFRALDFASPSSRNPTDNNVAQLDELHRSIWLESISHLPATHLAGRCWILDSWQFVRLDDPAQSATPLPASWDVTSDSIAARAAELSSADELVLLKSALPAETTIAACAAAGFVDRFFPCATARLRSVRVVNLRDSSFPSQVLTPADV